MGCAGSKLDDLPAVALCRKRTEFLEEAIRHRYALADAHREYARSLRSVGATLHRLIEGGGGAMPPPSPVLPLPPQRKGDPDPVPVPASSLPPAVVAAHSHSRSHSGSHLHFHSSDSETDSDSPLHSAGASPLRHHLGHGGPSEMPVGHMNINYARSQPAAASVSFEQPPPEVVHSSSAYPYFGYPYTEQNPSFYPYPYPDYASSSYPAGGGYGGGFWGMGSPPAAVPGPATAGDPSSSSRAPPPPPPPPPPSGSTWDFLNVFESSYETQYPAPYTPSRSSKEVREEEGIPDLEDEEHEVVKEVHGDQKFAASASASASGTKDDIVSGVGEDPPYKPRPAEAGVDTDDEVHVVEKNVVADSAAPQVELRSAAARKYEGISDVASEIRVQFERASATIDGLSGILEVGKLPYQPKSSVYYQVSSRIICVMAPPSDIGDLLVFDEDSGAGTKSLSSTLQKLFIWERKLYDEVKAEEKMRVLHDRKCKCLRVLDEKGSEAHKIDSTHTVIRKLSTKIRIAIQIVESISKKINNLRDLELLPQINELIQGFVGMWRVMLECHRTQCGAILEAQNLDHIMSGRRLSDGHMELLLKLELELLDWIGNFSAWVAAQRNYVKSLNGWLMLCLHYEPEVTPDGVVPFSPGRIGAPPVFVICNYWSQMLGQISEREVVGALNALAANVRHAWDSQMADQRLRLTAGNDVGGQLRAREQETLSITRAVDALNKKLVSVAGHDGGLAMHPDGAAAGAGGEQLGLRQVFEAMESFTSRSMKAYEELCARAIEEERLVGENAKVP